MPRLTNLVRAANLKAAVKLYHTDDQALLSIFEGSAEDRFGTLATSMGLQWPATEAAVDAWKKKQLEEEHRNWRALPMHVQGTLCFRNNPIGNAATALRKSVLFPGEEVDLLKLRANMFSTKEFLSRIDEDNSLS